MTMSGTDVVVVRGLSTSYGGRRVVDGLDFDVRAGEIVGLIGANGADKTTTGECVQGLRRPDAGSLRVLGLAPVTQGERLQGLVGSQLQSSALPDRLRVGEALQLFAGRQEEALLERFGLTGTERNAFASLSGGERQRLFLVLALVNRPRLVILDEPTHALYPSARRGVWSVIDQLRADGTAVLLVTDELEEVEQLCNRVVVMRAGRVLDTGSPAELVERHGPLGPCTRARHVRRRRSCGGHAPRRSIRIRAQRSPGRRPPLGSRSGGRRRSLARPGGQCQSPPVYRDAPAGQAASPAALDRVTGRERDVLAPIGDGATNGEIPGALYVSKGTVKTHVNHLFAKLGLRDRPAAVIFAYDHGRVAADR